MTREMTQGSLHEALAGFIREELSYDWDGLRPDTDLIENGIVDSISLLRLINFIEERFQILVRDEDMIVDNFRSLAAIDAFVQRSRGASSP